jgi:hypothetical protein
VTPPLHHALLEKFLLRELIAQSPARPGLDHHQKNARNFMNDASNRRYLLKIEVAIPRLDLRNDIYIDECLLPVGSHGNLFACLFSPTTSTELKELGNSKDFHFNRIRSFHCILQSSFSCFAGLSSHQPLTFSCPQLTLLFPFTS